MTHRTFDTGSSGNPSPTARRTWPRRLTAGALAAALFWAVAGGMGTTAAVAQTGDDSIFGDKVKPSTEPTPRPKPKPPEEIPPTPPPSTTTNPPPTPPKPTPPKPAAPPPKPKPVKLPIPPSPELVEVEKTVRAVYEAEFASKKPQDQVTLAGKLLEASKADGVTPAEKYVLLREAANAAAGAGDAEVAMRSADAIAKDFLVRVVDFKSTLLQNASRGALAREAAGAKSLTRAALDVADAAVAGAEYETAFKLATVVEVASRNAKDDAVEAEAAPRVTELRRVRNEYVKIAPLLDKVRQDPADAASHLKIGRFYCLAAGDWQRGLPYLQKAGDATLKELADLELSNPQDVASRVKLADAWWELAKKEPGPNGDQAKRHAQAWYRTAEAEAKGVTLVKIQQRLAAPTTAVAGTGTAPATGTAGPAGEKFTPKNVSMLKLTKLSEATVAGTWGFLRGGGGLQSDMGNSSRVQFPYEPPAEYDLTMDVTIVRGYGTLTAVVPRPDGTEGHLCFGMFGTLFGLQNGYTEGTTLKRRTGALHFGDRITMTLRVRKDRIVGLVGGAEIFDTKPDYTNMSGLFTWKLSDPKCIGIGTDGTVVTFHRVEVKEISGPGTKK